LTSEQVGYGRPGDSFDAAAMVIVPIRDSENILDIALIDNVGQRAFSSTRFWLGSAKKRMAWWKQLAEDRHSHVIFRQSEKTGCPLCFCVMIEHFEGVCLAKVTTDAPRLHGLLSALVPWVGIAILWRKFKLYFPKQSPRLLRSPEWPISSCLFIDQFAVHPDSMGMGLGKKLLGDAILFAQRKKTSTIELRVDKGNSRAIALYRKSGFRIIEESRSSYRLGLRVSD
jgi:ribosomal protein S18 acetylase RimI-like enzyme